MSHLRMSHFPWISKLYDKWWAVRAYIVPPGIPGIFPCQGYRPVTPPDATRVCNTNQWLVGFDRVRVGVYLLQPTAVYLQQYGYLFFVSYVAVRRDPHPFFSELPLGQSRCAMLASAPAGWCSTIQHWYGILVVSVKHVAYWPTCNMIRDHRESAPWQSR